MLYRIELCISYPSRGQRKDSPVLCDARILTIFSGSVAGDL